MQENTFQPAAILHVDRDIQSQRTQKRLTVHAVRGIVAYYSKLHHVHYVARDEADREKDQDAQYEQGRDDEQQQPDNISSHVMNLIEESWEARS